LWSNFLFALEITKRFCILFHITSFHPSRLFLDHLVSSRLISPHLVSSHLISSNHFFISLPLFHSQAMRNMFSISFVGSREFQRWY